MNMEHSIVLYLILSFVLFNFAFGYINHRFKDKEQTVIKKDPQFIYFGVARFVIILVWFVVYFLAEGYKLKIFAPLVGSGAALTAIRLFGLALYSAGGILVLWARYNLGEWFAPRLIIKKGQRVVQEGPYRYMRHPIYTGGMSIMWGLTLALDSLITLLLLAVPFTILLQFLIRNEQKLLASSLKDYSDYQSKVGKFLPHLRKD